MSRVYFAMLKPMRLVASLCVLISCLFQQHNCTCSVDFFTKLNKLKDEEGSNVIGCLKLASNAYVLEGESNYVEFCKEIIRDILSNVYHAKSRAEDIHGETMEFYINLNVPSFAIAFLHSQLEIYKSDRSLEIPSFIYSKSFGVTQVYLKEGAKHVGKYINPNSSGSLVYCNTFSKKDVRSTSKSLLRSSAELFEQIMDDTIPFNRSDFHFSLSSSAKYALMIKDGSNRLLEFQDREDVEHFLRIYYTGDDKAALFGAYEGIKHLAYIFICYLILFLATLSCCFSQ